MKIQNPWIILLFAISFTFLFYKQSIGLNLLIFEVVLITTVFVSRKTVSFENPLIAIVVLMLSSAILYIINFTLLALFVNIILVIIFAAYCLNPSFRSLHNAVPAALGNVLYATRKFLLEFNRDLPRQVKPSYLVIFVIPIAIMTLYIGIYSASSPFFLDVVNNISNHLAALFTWRVKYIQLILLFFLGIIIITNFIYTKHNTYVIDDKEAKNDLYRERNTLSGKTRAIQFLHEYRAGVFLFFSLNIILLVVNVLDIYHVWFNFKWEGQFLKQFVHEGTYVLIFSILLAIAMILYLFRRNMNFYTGNKLLKVFAYIWLVQNAVLAVSVGVRNFWYVQHYALAYKRIGVFFFLLFILYLLIIVFMKVRTRKSHYYLLKNGSWAFLLILYFMSVFNWDNIIAKYNFSHYHKSFVHLDFLATLPDKTLHVLDIPMQELEKIQLHQNELFPQLTNYLSSEEYKNFIDIRKSRFMKKHREGINILSWNYAEYRAFREMQKQDKKLNY